MNARFFVLLYRSTFLSFSSRATGASIVSERNIDVFENDFRNFHIIYCCWLIFSFNDVISYHKICVVQAKLVSAFKLKI